MLGQAFHLGEQKFSDHPLIVPTIYKACVYSLFIFAFGILEHFMSGYIHGKNAIEITHELIDTSMNEIIIRTWIKFIALVPFFAFIEMERIIGEGKLYELFLKKRK